MEQGQTEISVSEAIRTSEQSYTAFHLPVLASFEYTAELPDLWIPPGRRNSHCNRPTTSASANTSMGFRILLKEGYCCIRLPVVHLIREVMASSFIEVGRFTICRPLPPAVGRFCASAPGEYSLFDHFVLIYWRSADLSISLQLQHCTCTIRSF